MKTKNIEPNGTSVNTILALFFTAVILLILSISSCKSPEKIMDKAYETVSTDPAPATEKRKAQLVSWVAANFPQKEKVIEKEVIKIEIDTTQYQVFRAYIRQLNERLSIVNCPTLNADSIFQLAKETIKPETITKTKTIEKTTIDTSGNWLREKKMQELIAEIAATKGQKKVAEDNLENEKVKSGKKDKYLWYFIASLVVLVLSHILRSKLSLPFKIPTLK